MDATSTPLREDAMMTKKNISSCTTTGVPRSTVRYTLHRPLATPNSLRRSDGRALLWVLS